MKIRMKISIIFSFLSCILTSQAATMPSRGGCASPFIKNGRHMPDTGSKTISPSTIVSFSCFDGLTLNGIETVVCNNDGTWSNRLPTCEKKVICKRPTMPHGSFSPLLPLFTDYEEGMHVTFSCHGGFELKGETFVSCTPAGQWSSELPMCHSLTDASNGCSPPVLENGSVSPSPGYGSKYYSPSSFITFNCNTRFFLMGVTSAICLENGRWSADPPVCDITCEKPILTGGRIIPDLEMFPYITTMIVTYYCNPGFVLAGQQTSTCTNSGEWSTPYPICRSTFRQLDPLLPHSGGNFQNTCRLNTFPFGKVAPQLPGGSRDYQPDVVVEFYCNEGRVLVGPPIVECTASSKWSDPLPTCEVGCPVPGITNAQIQPKFESYDEYFTPGVTAIVKCNAGTVLVGAPTLVCQNDGSWSRGFPSCIASSISAIDNDNFVRTTEQTTEARISGGHQNPNRREEIICPKPMVKYGILISNDDLTELPVGAIVHFGCHVGFVLRGPSTLTCMFDGQWDNVLPECVIGCMTPFLEFGHITPDVMVSGEYFRPTMTASFVCIPGFEVRGTRTITCQRNGSWDNTPPTCESSSQMSLANTFDPQCSRPTIPHATFYPDRRSYETDTQIVVTCNDGYKTTDKLKAICTKSGTWTSIPKCQIGCSKPFINGGTFSPQLEMGELFYSVGQAVRFRCIGEKDLQGTSKIVCDNDGTWNAGFPSCFKMCRKPILKNGLHRPKGRRVGFMPNDRVTFTCIKGFKLMGSPTSICKDGVWVSSEQTACVSLKSSEVVDVKQFRDDPMPPSFIEQEPPTTTQSTSHHFYSSTTRYTTKRPTETTTYIPQTTSTPFMYTTRRPPSYTTMYTRNTVKTTTGCTIPMIQDGFVLRYNPGKTISIGTEITLMCGPKYILRGQNRITCQGDNSWSAQLPVCASLLGYCDKPAALKLGRFTPIQKQYSVGAKISYTCYAGNIMTGIRIAYCQSNGKFTTPPVCNPARPEANKQVFTTGLGRNQCRTPVIPEHATIVPNRAVYNENDEVQYSCKKGYKILGSQKTVCKGKYGFFPVAPRCEKIACVQPQVPRNGHIVNQKTKYYYGDKVEYGCITNYVIITKYHNVCGADAQYEYKTPDCSPPSCRHECNFVQGRSCQCDITCRWVKGRCCYDFEQFCRKLYYK